MILNTRFILPLLGISLWVISSSCSTKTAIKTGDTLEVAFSKATNLYSKGDYGDAARAFETVISMGRGSDIARDAQWLIAESYFKNKEYLISASEYRRFITFYPRSSQRMEAEFMEAYCYYKISPRYKLDQADTDRAITLFRIFIGRYPDAEKSKEAIKLLEELREKLALKSISSADMYMNLKLYLSAAMFYQTTMDKFPETAYAEESLAKQVKAYALYAELSIESKQAERYKMALDAFEKYNQLFPNGRNRALAEEYAQYAQRMYQRI